MRFDIVACNDFPNEVASQIQNYFNNVGVVVHEEKTKKNHVTIYAESTPNPGVLKFVANKNLTRSSFEFGSIEDAKHSPFATALFQFPFRTSIYITNTYVSITKFDIVEWEEITLELRTFIKTYIEEGKEMRSSTAAEELKKTTKQLDQAYEKLDDISKAIIKILEKHGKQAVVSQDGDIR